MTSVVTVSFLIAKEDSTFL